MRKILKSSLSLVIALTIILSCAIVGFNELDSSSLFAVKTEAANSGTCGEKLTWTLDDKGTLTISGAGDMTDFSESSSAPWSSVTSVVIENGVTSIGDYAFYWHSTLETITIPDSVKSIGSSVFYNCDSLTSIIIPDSVTSIGGSAFRYCRSLTSITIPDSVTSIGIRAFCNCSGLSAINVSTGNQYYTSVVGVLFNKDKTELIQYPAGKTCTSYTIPNSVTSIGGSAFYNCYRLKSVVLSNSVTSIGESAFYCCGSLTSITIPDGVTSIGEYAFEDCDSLTTITIPDSVTSIGKYAFEECHSLTTITIPDSVISIGESVFQRCKNLKSVTLPNSVTSIGGSAFLGCASLTSITIPDSVTSIGFSAFFGCASLTSITIPDSVTNIGVSAFNHCESLTSITIPDSITNIGSAAFRDCYSLTIITIPDSVISIGESAFQGCENLTSITIPVSVTSIGNSAFYDCYRLLDVYYTGSSNDWSNISIGSSNRPLFLATIHYNSVYCSHASTKWVTDKVVTCTVAGLKRKECTVCRQTLETETISATGHTESNWITDKVSTVNDAGSRHKECTKCGEVLKTAVISQLKPSTPALSSVTNVNGGVTIIWKAVSGADSYRVYRKTSSSRWSCLNNKVKSTSYTDKTTESGTTYYYTVKAENEAGVSGYNSTGISVKYLAIPKVTSIFNANKGITVKWGKTTGASGYYVYRKTGSGSWSIIYTAKSGSIVSYTDKSAKAGTTYYYTVRAYSGLVKSKYISSGAVRRLTIPVLKSITSAKSGVTLKWNKVTGATGYIVYRKTGSSSWSKMATVKGGGEISYLDKSANKGKTYTYTVRAYYGSSKSYYNTKGLSIKDKY